jgi:predicted RNA binding protein YcfA (HicA-like mRNA interferase family)
MPKFPVDAPKRRVVKTLEILGFVIVREKEHISLQRTNPDGSRTALTMPNHPTLKALPLRAIRSDPTVSAALLRPGF